MPCSSALAKGSSSSFMRNTRRFGARLKQPGRPPQHSSAKPRMDLLNSSGEPMMKAQICREGGEAEEVC